MSLCWHTLWTNQEGMCQYEMTPVTRVPSSVATKEAEFRKLLSPAEPELPVVLPQYDLVNGTVPQNR